MNVDLNTLRAFIVFADRLNFTHAADELFISQPALHMKIQQLAESLGVPLYRKIGRRLELTEQGKATVRFGRQMLEQADVFAEELQGGTTIQQVVMAAGEGSYLYLLGDAIRRFLKTSDAHLELLTLNREGIIDAVQSGKAHLGVAAFAESVPRACEATLLRKVDQVLVMPKNHELVSRKKIRLTDLRNAHLVVPPAGRPHRQMLSRALQSADVDWQIAVEAGGWELMLHFVKLGLGLAVVNSMVTVPPGLVARPISELPKVHYYLIHLSGAARTGAAAKLKTLLLTPAS